MERLEFDPNGVTRHDLVYTALSRVRNIDCLYLVNKLMQKKIVISPKVLAKLERLEKKRKLDLQHGLNSIPTHEFLVIAILNTHILVLHNHDVACDIDLMQDIILCLQETHMQKPPTTTFFPDSFILITKYSLHGRVTMVEKHSLLMCSS